MNTLRCAMCRSLKHTTEEHHAKLAQGRRQSPIWREAVLVGNAKKRAKPLVCADPAAKSAKIKERLNRPEVRARLSEARRANWAQRDGAARKLIAQKISAAEKGRPFTSEHLANLRAANSAPRKDEHRRKLSESNIGRKTWNIGLTKETHPSLRSNSEKQIGRVPNYNKYRTEYDGPKGILLMRSRWEVAYARYLDRQNIDWQYEPRWFVIGTGEWNGHSYTPDFYLPITDEYIEIKGRMTVENAKKMQRFNEVYPEIKLTILGHSEMMVIGLVDRSRRLIN